jgi:hypothetical protein
MNGTTDLHERERTRAVPPLFCWTKMGAEAGQPLEAILRRKDLERACGEGVFAWGVGNSVGPALEYARCTARGELLDAFFTPMRTRARAADVAPMGTVMWRACRADDGTVAALPWHMLVTSRRHAASGVEKRHHFALICRRAEPLLDQGEEVQIDANCARNLVSNGQVGASQVTAVVKYAASGATKPNRVYRVLFRATLTHQAFVRLLDPVPIEGPLVQLYEAACEATDPPEWRARILALKEAAGANPVRRLPTQARLFSDR